MIDHIEPTTDEPELALRDLDDVIGGVTKVGVGTLTLGSSNTYTGTTQVNAGIIAI